MAGKYSRAAFEGGELSVCPNGQEPTFRFIIAHRIESHRVTTEISFPDALPDVRMPLEMCRHDVSIQQIAIHRSS